MFSSRLRRALCSLLCICGLLGGALAQAGVTAERTRVIFPGENHEKSLLLANLNAYPVLVQTWIDDGALNSTPDTAVAPIMPLPPVFRMAPGERRSLRLLFTGGNLPADRESLFWLNLYEIPPSESVRNLTPEQALLVVTMRTQMKVFYRPKDLPSSPEAAARKLAFSVRQEAGRAVLRVENGSPYHVTLANLDLRGSGQGQVLRGDMVGPFAHLDLPIEPQAVTGKNQVVFTWLDDDGNTREDNAPLR